MATRTMRDYRGVILATKENVTIKAGTQEAARNKMKKMHGAEFGPNGETLWVVAQAV